MSTTIPTSITQLSETMIPASEGQEKKRHCVGNLFLDSPDHLDYEDLVKQANYRQAWRQHVHRRFGTQPKRKRKHKRGNKPQHNFLIVLANQRHNSADRGIGESTNAARPRAVPLKPVQWPTPMPPTSKVMRANATIQTQLPAAWRPQHQPNSVKISKKQKTKKAPKVLTDTQRAAWAHVHFIIHHGTPADAARLLLHLSNCKTTPADALNKVRQMSRMRVPANLGASGSLSIQQQQQQ